MVCLDKSLFALAAVVFSTVTTTTLAQPVPETADANLPTIQTFSPDTSNNIVDTPYSGIASSDNDNYSDLNSNQNMNNNNMATMGTYNSAPPTISNLRIATGINSDSLDESIVPRGNIFTSFDVRPNGQGSVNGFQARVPWTQASINSTLGTASTSLSPLIRTGVISSDQELTTALNIAVSANGAFLGGAGKVAASFGYSSDQSQSSHIVSGYTYGTMALPGTMLANVNMLQLEDDVLHTLQTDVDTFINTYGTHYVKTRVYGCEASTTYTYSCTTESAKLDIKASISGSYDGGAYSVGGSVDGKYSTYSKANMCTYSGNMYSSGLAIENPSQSQLLDDNFMNTYWNQFSQQCTNAAANNGKLLYVELGTWMEVPAVSNALANNVTATNILNFYGAMKPADLNAVALGEMYNYKVQEAIDSMEDDYMTPWATTGFFDRTTGQGMSPVQQSYWTSLPAAHASIQDHLAKSDFSNFVNDDAVAAAITSGTSISSLVKLYFTNARQLYRDAVKTYQYTYSGVSATVLSFDNDNATPISSKLYVRAGQNDCNPFIKYGMETCASQITHGGLLGLEFMINMLPSQSVAGATKLYAHFAVPNVVGYAFDAEDFSNGTPFDSLDFTDYLHTKYCGTCPPIRFDFTIHYTMQDITFNAAPY